MTTKLQLHLDKWKNCDKCELSTQRTRMVFWRGVMPCDVLFVGEAPGDSEDALGKPFIGPAGKYLDDIISDACPEDLRLAFTNLVACYPREMKELGVNEPPRPCIRSCQPRLKEFIDIANPRMIVTVGALSDRWAPMADTSFKGRWVSITHPAALLRANLAQRSLLRHRCLVVLGNAFESIRV